MKITWCLKQLFPMTYRSHWKDANGRSHFSVWKMWFGRVYQSEDFAVEVI